MNKDNIILSPAQKALRINLDKEIYGSFVEIGAGQEVARQFFRVGSASTTIAKTMSAYDRDFSNAIYGKEDDGRFVSKNRLINMLNHEYSLIEERLRTEDHPNTKFFAFADTVTTIDFKKKKKGHGWIGIRFQKYSNTKPNDFIFHVRLNDQDSKLQQETLGIIGTNLIHACFFNNQSAKNILNEIYHNLSRNNVEIDMIEVVGPDFENEDNRLLSMVLVKEGYTDAVTFNTKKENKHPSDILRKKNILTLRGSFRPVTKVNIDMLKNGIEKFIEDKKVKKENIQILFEITLSNLRAEGEVDESDFLDRVEILCSLGYTVMISNFQKYYKLIEYLSVFSNKRMGIIIGADNLIEMFEEKYYRNLNGGILEAFGIIFTRDVKIYLYPFIKDQTLLNSTNIPVHPRVKSLYDYMNNNKRIIDINHSKDVLKIFSRQVLKMIKDCKDGEWEHMVPKGVSELIKDRSLFGSTNCQL